MDHLVKMQPYLLLLFWVYYASKDGDFSPCLLAMHTRSPKYLSSSPSLSSMEALLSPWQECTPCGDKNFTHSELRVVGIRSKMSSSGSLVVMASGP